jgi:hypothetical protein
MTTRSVLTIATGNPVYIQMAVNLARSFKHWHKDSLIQFSLLTDQKRLIPDDLLDINIIEIEPGSYGKGFSTKLHLDTFAPAEQTLFIDADCLCYGPLESVFDRFKGHTVSVVGEIISEGECWGNVRSFCERFSLDGIPKFVGGIYYIEKGEVASQVYATARRLESMYDEIGLRRLRGVPNEEPLVALAMALHGQKPVPEDGSIKADLMFYPSKVEVDVFRGKAALWNLPDSRNYNPAWPLRESHPLVVHFNCTFVERGSYAREAIRLNKVLNKGWPLPVADSYAYVTRYVPDVMQTSLKDLLRPVYRRLLGVRKIKKSNRM